MNIDMLTEYLETYNKDELFYKKYYSLKQNPVQFAEFIKGLDLSYLTEHNLIIPELLPSEIPRLMLDERYFDVASETSVHLCKHNRYTPPFMHTHVFFEIIYVLSGQCRHNVSGELQVLTEGDLCFLSPSISHSIVVNDDSIIINILMRRSTIEDIFFNTIRNDNIISDFVKNSIYIDKYTAYMIFHTTGDETVRQQILEMYMEQFQAGESSDRIITSMLMVFFAKLVRKYKKTVQLPPAFSQERITLTARLIDDLLEDYASVTLSGFADKLNCSPTDCSESIEVLTGLTFQQLLNSIRFQKAENMLLNTTLSIRTVSEKLGYENPGKFMKAFKSSYGLSPLQFRKKGRI